MPTCFGREGRIREALGEIDAVLSVVESELPERLVGALSEQADFRHAAGDLAGAVESASRALTLVPHPSLTPRHYANAVDSLCWALLDLGPLGRGRTSSLAGRGALYSSGWRSVDLDLDAALLATYRGDFAEADACVRSAWSHFVDGPDTPNLQLAHRPGQRPAGFGHVGGLHGRRRADPSDVAAPLRVRALPDLSPLHSAGGPFSWRGRGGRPDFRAAAPGRRDGNRGPTDASMPREDLVALAIEAAASAPPGGDSSAGRSACSSRQRCRPSARRGHSRQDWQHVVDSLVGLPGRPTTRDGRCSGWPSGWSRRQARRDDAHVQPRRAVAEISEELGARPLLQEVYALSRRARLGNRSRGRAGTG